MKNIKFFALIISLIILIPASFVNSQSVFFLSTLQKGMTSDQVKLLQEFLKQYPDIYPQGLVTGYFGTSTETAVKLFQTNQGIQAIGIVGPITRNRLNALISSATTSSINISTLASLVTVTGATGTSGSIGLTGVAGSIGGTGATGTAGIAGERGRSGGIGLTGLAGATGSMGATGTAGMIGFTGLTGLTGATGTAGTIGLTGGIGATGTAGTIGFTGLTGLTGATGTSGTIGFTGLTGLTGATGTAGTIGLTGNIGATGTAGTIGFTGLTGLTGATGTPGTVGATGPTGPAGPAGGGGISAYGYAVGQSDATIGANANVVFDLGATPFPNAGYTSVPTPGGTDASNANAFIVSTSGAYEFDFYIAGNHASGATVPLEFALWRNGSIASVGGNAFEFRSNQQATWAVGDTQVVIGHGIIQLTAGDVIQLHNRTNLTTDTVTVTSVSVGGEAGPNRTLSLKKISS